MILPLDGLLCCFPKRSQRQVSLLLAEFARRSSCSFLEVHPLRNKGDSILVKAVTY
jgi:hypothetical protein